MPVRRSNGMSSPAAPNSPQRWRRRSRTSCRQAIARRGTGFLAVSGGTTPALLFAELSQGRDRLGQGDRHAGRRAARAADIAALERQARRRQAFAGAGGGGAFRAALPWNRRSPKRPQRSRERRWASCPGRSTSRSSAWDPTATRRRSSPMRRTSPTLLGRRCGQAGAAGRGGERRRAPADADARRIAEAGLLALHIEGRGEAAGARASARRRGTADPRSVRGCDAAGGDLLGRIGPFSRAAPRPCLRTAGKPPTFPRARWKGRPMTARKDIEAITDRIRERSRPGREHLSRPDRRRQPVASANRVDALLRQPRARLRRLQPVGEGRARRRPGAQPRHHHLLQRHAVGASALRDLSRD